MSRRADPPALGASRARVLRLLQDEGRPLGAAEVATSLGVHANSARFHLEALVRAGLAERGREDRGVPGRPTVLYAATAAAATEEDGYRELAGILTAALGHSGSTPGDAAEAAGAERGRRLAAQLAAPATGKATVTAAGAARAVVDGLARLGFQSSSVATRAGRRIDIVPCPYLALARARPDVVCAVHRGLMRGVLEQLDAPVTVEDLEPFAQPDRCVAHLRRVG